MTGPVTNGEKAPLKAPLVKIGLYSLTVNLALTAAKLALAFITGSLALRADAVHSAVDVFASLALVLGLMIAGRRSRNFPYGLYKIENLVSALMALLLFFTAYEIVSAAARGGTAAGLFSGWVLAPVAVLALIPLFFGRYELSQGRRYNSPGLMADGSQFRADVLGSTVVFAGLLGQLLGVALDRVAAGIVALFIVYAAGGLLASSLRVLLDASVRYAVLERVRALLQAEPLVGTVISLAGRNSGRYIFIEAAITVRTSDLKKAHLLSEKIELAVKNAIPNIDRVLIHYEPEARTRLRYAVALSDREGRISADFGKSLYFAFIDIDVPSRLIVRREIIANPYLEVEKGRGLKVAELLLAQKADVLVSRESLTGKGPGYALDNAGVEMQQTGAGSLSEVLGQFTAETGA